MVEKLKDKSGSDETWWLVTSPEQYEVIPVCDDGTGPSEVAYDFALVRADTSKAAKWEAWRLWKKHGADWPANSQGGHPLSGVKAQRWETIGEGLDPIPTARDRQDWQPFVSEVSA